MWNLILKYVIAVVVSTAIALLCTWMAYSDRRISEKHLSDLISYLILFSNLPVALVCLLLNEDTGKNVYIGILVGYAGISGTIGLAILFGQMVYFFWSLIRDLIHYIRDAISDHKSEKKNKVEKDRK